MGKRFTGDEIQKLFLGHLGWEETAEQINTAIKAEETKEWEPDWSKAMPSTVAITLDKDGFFEWDEIPEKNEKGFYLGTGLARRGVYPGRGVYLTKTITKIWIRPENPRDELAKRIAELSDEEARKLLARLREEN